MISNQTIYHQAASNSAAEIEQGNAAYNDNFKIPSSSINDGGFDEIYSQLQSLRAVLTSQ